MSARILIIEDDEAILKFLRRGLAYEGYQVDTATDGQSGLGLARDNPPDLVVLDLMLPGIDGMEVCRRLRAGGSVPILILTAKDTARCRPSRPCSARGTSSVPYCRAGTDPAGSKSR